MVAQIPLQYAAADALYAAGLGLLTASLYTCVKMLLPNTKLFAFICDFATLCLAGVLYSSVATARFYSGVVRWYTVLALALGYAAWLFTAHSKLVYSARLIKYSLVWPLFKLIEKIVHPIYVKIKAKLRLKREKARLKKKTKVKNKTKQLQKPCKVLYNSK